MKYITEYRVQMFPRDAERLGDVVNGDIVGIIAVDILDRARRMYLCIYPLG